MSEFQLKDQLCFSLYSASNLLTRLYRPVLEQFELTYPQFLVMMALWQEEKVPLRQLSVLTRLDAGTITPIVKRLEAKGFLERVADQQDERVKRVLLTEKGRTIRAPIREAHHTMLAQYADSREKLEQLRVLCRDLVEIIEEKE